MDNKIIKLHIGDQRLESLIQAVVDTLHERGGGLPIPSILGVLDLVKDYIKSEAAESNMY